MSTPLLAAPLGVGKLLGDEIAHLLTQHSGLPKHLAGRIADELLQRLETHAYARPACMQCGSFDVAPYEDSGRDYESGPWSDQGWACRCGWRDPDCNYVVVLYPETAIAPAKPVAMAEVA